MKVKLLKKIRKRYSITRVDELASNPSDLHIYAKKECGLPFYLLKVTETLLDFHVEVFKTFEEARNKLCKWIISDYGEKFRHRDQKSSKVWWVKK